MDYIYLSEVLCMFKYKFLADGWKEEEAFYCVADDILIACDLFEDFCKSHNKKVSHVIVDYQYNIDV